MIKQNLTEVQVNITQISNSMIELINYFQRLFKAALTAIFFLCLLISLSNATVYYVDSELGSDLNTGTSAEQPWQTLVKINSTTFLPGDSILGLRYPARF